VGFLVNKFRQGWFHHELPKEAGIYYQPVLAYQPGIKCSDIPPDTIIPLLSNSTKIGEYHTSLVSKNIIPF
jgi:hypothetical protein